MHKIVRALFIVPVALCLILAGNVLAGKKTEPKKHEAVRLHRVPTMRFLQGEMRQNFDGTWRAGKHQLRFMAEIQWTVEGRTGNIDGPQAERDALLMGYWRGDVFLVYSGRMLLEDYQLPSDDGLDRVIWSDVDPHVGESTGPS